MSFIYLTKISPYEIYSRLYKIRLRLGLRVLDRSPTALTSVLAVVFVIFYLYRLLIL
jgi:hypothetical protein